MLMFWVGILFDLVFAGLYYALTRAVSNRKVSGDAQWALFGFAAWWAALAINSGVSVIGKLAQLWLGWSPSAYVGFIGITFLIIMYGLAGLQYYLSYLVSGWWNAWKPISAYYLALFGYTMFLVDKSRALSVGIDSETGALDVEYAVDLDGSIHLAIFSLALIVPVLIGAIAYASFFFRVHDRSQRFRIAMVSLGFIVWFGVGLYGSLGAYSGLYWTLFTKAIAAIAIWVNYQAFRPSPWMQERFGIQPL